MDGKGLTLLELILALAMVGIVLLASSVLYLSSMRTTLSANADARLQRNLDYIFRDMELRIRGAQSGTPIASEPKLFECASSPCVNRTSGPYGLEFQIQFLNSDGNLVAYKYYEYDETAYVGRYRCTATDAAIGDCDYIDMPATGLIPYAAYHKPQPANETSYNQAFNNCINANSSSYVPVGSSTNCEDQGIYPVFEVSSDKKIVWVSFKAKTKLFGNPSDGRTGKDLVTSGITKAIYIHHEGD